MVLFLSSLVRALPKFNGHDVHSALQLLGLVAFSDAFVYLKRFDELSAGQQYRAMLAKLLSADCNLWLADEFCVNLDPVSANCVASRLGSLTRELKAILVVATPHPDVIAAPLGQIWLFASRLRGIARSYPGATFSVI